MQLPTGEPPCPREDTEDSVFAVTPSTWLGGFLQSQPLNRKNSKQMILSPGVGRVIQISSGPKLTKQWKAFWELGCVPLLWPGATVISALVFCTGRALEAAVVPPFPVLSLQCSLRQTDRQEEGKKEGRKPECVMRPKLNTGFFNLFFFFLLASSILCAFIDYFLKKGYILGVNLCRVGVFTLES